jgi:hypothetical protein
VHNLERRAERDPDFVITDLSGKDVEGVEEEIVDLESHSELR